ncbi:Pre-mRNA-processing factor 39 [Triticum urartu]|uniref:Pre-mRNA-processing factor 39 n=1 Tax=Triticum urartu TaxID=4572 RepID=M7YGB5_TRIUA|nr:Pre-mRNA-processing factor 39 [Triticum urartu]
MALFASGDCIVPPLRPPSPVKAEAAPTPIKLESYSWNGVVREWVSVPPIWLGATPAQEQLYLEQWRDSKLRGENNALPEEIDILALTWWRMVSTTFPGGFKKLVTSLEQEVTHCGAEISSENLHTSEAMESEESEGYISTKVARLFDQGGHLKPEVLKQYLFAGERFYQRSSELDKEICGFEASIKRPFFHVKPLDDDQLENWNLYLDFVEKNGDFDWAVKLYERCLIPCANYSEFWIRYAEYVDAKGGREIANYALGRASSCFVKGVPSFSMYYSMFKEQIGDAPGARALFVEGSSNSTSDFCMNINRLANMEKRMGNTKAATEIYENAIQDAMQKQNTEVLPDLYTNFAQFKYAVGNMGPSTDIKYDMYIL